jgi:alanine-alpha-ketoisovalerate/valine-pyruvate aminotransferase
MQIFLSQFYMMLMMQMRLITNMGCYTEVVALTEDCSAVILNHMPKKLGDPGSFSIPYVVEKKTFTALCDLGSSVSVLPSAVSQILQLGTLKSTPMTLQLADRTLRKPVGILEDVPVQVGNFAYPVDFVILEMEDNAESMILGRPFLATAGAIIDVKGGTLKLQFGSEHAEFSMKHASHVPNDSEQCHSLDIVEKSVLENLPEMQPQELEA